MRKIFGSICFFLLISLNTKVLAHDNVRLISVTGVAEKSFQPDIVRINLSIWGKGESAKKAQNNAQSSFELLKKSIETFKIKKEDIRTTSYELNPEYVYDQKTNKNNISGYNANQGVSVTLRKVDDAGSFLDALTTNSKANTSGVTITTLNFDLEKRLDEERALMTEAVKAAAADADVLARAAQVKLKGIYRLAPRGASAPVPMFRADAMMSRSKEMGAPQLMSGEVKVSAEVTADYIVE